MEFRIFFKNIDDVHAFVKIAEKIVTDVTIISGRFKVDGKSLMGLYSIDLSKELSVKIVNPNDVKYFQEFIVESEDD